MLESGIGDLLRKEELESERQIAKITMYLALLLLLPIIVSASIYTRLDNILITAIIMIFVVVFYSAYTIYLIKKDRYRWVLKYIGVSIEIVFVTYLIFLVSRIESGSSGKFLTTSLYGIYFLWIIVSGMRYNYRVPLFAGIMSAILYIMVVMYITVNYNPFVVYVARDRKNLQFLLEIDDAIINSITLLFAGIFASMVSKRFSKLIFYASSLKKTEILRDIYEQEINIIRNFKKRFLSRRTTSILDLDISFDIRSTIVVGNNFFDIIEIDNNRILLLAADIVGSPIGNAFLLFITDSIIRAIARDKQRLDGIVSEANKIIYENSSGDISLPMFILTYDTSNGICSFVFAGYDMGIIVIKENGNTITKDGTGVPLGLIENEEIAIFDSIELDYGNSMIIYSKNILEVSSKTGKRFSKDNLISLVKRYNYLPAGIIYERIINELSEFSDGHLPDNITLMVLKRRNQ